MMYDHYGTVPTNNLSSVFPQYITLNNYYINNNQIHSSLPKNNSIYDYNLTEYNNYKNDLNHGYHVYDSPNRGTNFMPFFSPQKEIIHQKPAFFSPPPNKSYQNFENILSKFLSDPPDDIVIVKKISSGKNLNNAILGTDAGPKDQTKNSKSNETYKSSFNIFGNDLKDNFIKTEKLNYNKDKDENYAKHPLDNTINILQKNKYLNNNGINIIKNNPKDNLKYYVEYKVNQKPDQSNEKDANEFKQIKPIDTNLDKNYQNGKSLSNIVLNMKGQIKKFSTNGKEIGKYNMINNKMNAYNNSEVKNSKNNFNINKGKYEVKEVKENKKNIIIKDIRKVNINSLNNNNIQNNPKVKPIGNSINKREIKKDNINKGKNHLANNAKANNIKEDKNVKNFKKEDIKKEKKYKIVKINNEIKNKELNNINKIIEKTARVKSNTTEENKDKYISIYNQVKGRNIDINKTSNTDFKVNNSIKYKKVISNIDKNNIFNSLNMEKKTQNYIQKNKIYEKYLITDTKLKINENDFQKNKDNENRLRMNVLSADNKNYKEIKLPKQDKNEYSPKLSKKKINIVRVPKVNIIEDKDNINEFYPIRDSTKIEDLNKNINNDIQQEIIPEKTSRNGSLKFNKKKKLLYIVDLDERMSRFLNNKNSINTPEKTKNKVDKPLKEEQIFNKIKKTFQTPLENPTEKSEFLLNPDSFKYLGVIGEGEYGKIYLAQNIFDNQYYAMKIEIFDNRGDAHKRQVTTKLIKDLLKKTNSQGIIKIYGDIWLKKNNLYNYYVLMEKAELDMEQELIIRNKYMKYYSETELTNVLCQLIVACAQMQKNKIAHRDIKPQNILILNGIYKLCDFGEAKLFNKGDVIIQRIRGSELYMSPILFFGMKNKFEHVKHNVYKSDVFSLGLCILLAGSLNYDSICRIRELTDMEKIKNIIMYYLSKRYSNTFTSFLFRMLEVDENKRPNFLQLESLLIKK